MAQNKWILHLQKIRKENPKLAKARPGSPDHQKLIKIAKASYK